MCYLVHRTSETSVKSEPGALEIKQILALSCLVFVPIK